LTFPYRKIPIIAMTEITTIHDLSTLLHYRSGKVSITGPFF